MKFRELVVRDGRRASAEALDISLPYLSQLMNGRRRMTARVLMAAYRVWGRELDVMSSVEEMGYASMMGAADDQRQ